MSLSVETSNVDPYTVLVVEDDPPIRRALNASLRQAGYRVLISGDGSTALDVVEADRPDAVILDLGLPGIDGLDVIRALRTQSKVPIVVLSARAEEEDKVGALDLGADDYVQKPFGMPELLARTRAAIRRGSGENAQHTVALDGVVIDLRAKSVTRDGDAIHLTPTEWKILEYLVVHRGRLVGHTELLRAVWGPQYGNETNYLRVYSAQLRKKLERDPSHPRLITTAPGLGLRFGPDPDGTISS